MYKKNRILMTGGTGFIGSNLTNALIEDGHEVHILARSIDQPNYKLNNHASYYIINDLDLNVLINNCSPDIIIHLAFAKSGQNIANIIECNLQLCTLILESLPSNKSVSIINTGTYWQHYNNKEYSPVNLYAASKEAFEKIAEYYLQVKNLKMLTLELFNNYGPNDMRRSLVCQLLHALQSGKPLDMSPGEQLLDFLHIDDVISGFQQALKHVSCMNVHSHKKFCLSSHQQISLKDLVSKIEKISTKKLDVRFGEKPYMERQIMKPEIKYPILPKWNPSISLDKGLSDLINTYQK